MGSYFSRAAGYIFYFIVFGGVVVFGPLVIVISLAVKKPYLPFFIAARYCQFFLRLFGIRIRVEGREFLKAEQAYLVLPNHQSFLDIPLIIRYVRPVSFLAKIEIKKWPLFGPAMEKANCIFVERSSKSSRSRVAPVMKDKIKKGVSFCVFPEGTRTRTGALQSFRPGIFKIALETKTPILPVSITGAFEVFPKRPVQLKCGMIDLKIHPPILPESEDSAETLRRKCYNSIASAFNSGHTQSINP